MYLDFMFGPSTVVSKQVDQVFIIVYFNEGVFDVVTAHATVFFFKSLGMLKNDGDCTRNVAYASHGVGFARTSLTVSKSCAVETLQETSNKRQCSSGEEAMLGTWILSCLCTWSNVNC